MPARLDGACLFTFAGVDASEPDICVYVEEWTDSHQLERRIHSASFRALLVLMESSIASPFVEIRDVVGLGGLDYVARTCGQPQEDSGAPGAREATYPRSRTK